MDLQISFEANKKYQVQEFAWSQNLKNGTAEDWGIAFFVKLQGHSEWIHDLVRCRVNLPTKAISLGMPWNGNGNKQGYVQ